METQIAHLPYWGEDVTLHGVQRFMEGVAYYQSLNIAREEGKEVPRGEAFQAAMLEAALKGTGLEV